MIGLLASPTFAQIESIFGKTVDGSEFVKIVIGPKVAYYIHKDEISNLNIDETQNSSALKYTLNLTNGKQFSLTKELTDIIIPQLDFTEIKL